MKNSDNFINEDRKPVAAGRFYPASQEQLLLDIEQYYKEVEEVKIPQGHVIQTLIAPHAGYVFSGVVAASAFQVLKQIPPRKKIFLIGSSHHVSYNGASIYNKGHYLTPLGKVKVDLELCNKLISDSKLFNYIGDAHSDEHSLEVQLPFLQYTWKNNFEIIPIIISTNDALICKKLASELQEYYTPDNLFVISTDLSHYPEYSEAVKVDTETVHAITSGNPDALLEQLQLNEQKHIPNLVTSMCGWTSVLTSMYLTKEVEGAAYIPILYKNSGDAKLYGTRDQVVGYQSIVITASNNATRRFSLTTDEKQTLIDTAHNSIAYYLNNKKRPTVSTENISKTLLLPGGAFVSIYYNNELFGCIGRMHSKTDSLISIVSDAAISAAFLDTRFERLNSEQLLNAQVEISVLTPLNKINMIDEIILGTHGIYISKGSNSGTFLPQVANNTNWTIEDFLGNCSKNKADIGWHGWKEADVFTYEAIVFRG